LSKTSPKIEFPCDYPIKIVGDSGELFTETVLELTRRHAPEVTAEKVSVRDSRHGNYRAVTITIRATGEPQLRALHDTLRRYPLVRMVL
jgi:uncharacterized protein